MTDRATLGAVTRGPAPWVRITPWRGRPDVARLDVVAPPSPSAADVDTCLDRLRESGFAEVVTGALAPADALAFVDAGFATRERLHLLTHDMRDLPPRTLRTRRVRGEDDEVVLAIDQQAFAEPWALDEPRLRGALSATPIARFRLAELDGAPAGYAISGRARDHGYLQRIAVAPGAQGRGLGTGLVVDALRWLARAGVRRTLVNTQLDNHVALRLYATCGFRLLPVGLSILGRAL
ncbi:MAG: GNAT family N-acetyltransferase [Acidimicrobiia bacterium]